MRRVMVVIAATFTLSACGEWRGDGHDEAIPDVLGAATGVKPSFGVLSQTLTDHADEDIVKNAKAEAEEPAAGSEGRGEAHNPHLAPARRE